MVLATMTHTPQATALRVHSPSKINLSLDVLSRRDDGFHQIRSVVLGVGLMDDLWFAESQSAEITLRCNHPDLPTDGDNLILQAAKALAAAAECTLGATIELTKRIPVAAGLGGGSGNAAATLMALNRLWGLGRTNAELMRIAAGIGSDVPLFFAMPSAQVTGRGEVVEPLRLRWSGWVLLVGAGCPVLTEAVYNAWLPDDVVSARPEDPLAIAGACTAVDVAPLCRNDLTRAIFRVAPAVRDLRDAIHALGVRPVQLSGAGQTAYVLFDDPDEADALCRRLVSGGIGTAACVVPTLSAPLTVS